MKNHSDYPKKLPLNDTYHTDPNISKKSFASFRFYTKIIKVVKFSNEKNCIPIVYLDFL